MRTVVEPRLRASLELLADTSASTADQVKLWWQLAALPTNMGGEDVGGNDIRCAPCYAARTASMSIDKDIPVRFAGGRRGPHVLCQQTVQRHPSPCMALLAAELIPSVVAAADWSSLLGAEVVIRCATICGVADAWKRGSGGAQRPHLNFRLVLEQFLPEVIREHVVWGSFHATRKTQVCRWLQNGLLGLRRELIRLPLQFLKPGLRFLEVIGTNGSRVSASARPAMVRTPAPLVLSRWHDYR